MTSRDGSVARHPAHQSAAQLAAEPAPFPSITAAAPWEIAYPDWRARLSRNFARHAEGRWEPLTRVSAAAQQPGTPDQGAGFIE